MICSRCGELLLEDRFMNWAARWLFMKWCNFHDAKTCKSNIVNKKTRLFPRSSEPNYSDEEVHHGSDRS